MRLTKLAVKREITRFKGLGEISPDEFGNFIGENIRLEPVRIEKKKHQQQILEFYMGKNTPDRQEFIIENLRFELDVIEEAEKEEFNHKLLIIESNNDHLTTNNG